jgi:hypothetical protein
MKKGKERTWGISLFCTTALFLISGYLFFQKDPLEGQEKTDLKKMFLNKIKQGIPTPGEGKKYNRNLPTLVCRSQTSRPTD